MDIPSNLPPRVESAFPIRLLALVIDGTLVGDELAIGPRTQRAVHAASGASFPMPRLLLQVPFAEKLTLTLALVID